MMQESNLGRWQSGSLLELTNSLWMGLMFILNNIRLHTTLGIPERERRFQIERRHSVSSFHSVIGHAKYYSLHWSAQRFARSLMFCTVLHCHALPCIVLHCPELPCIVLHCPALSCIVLHVLHCPARPLDSTVLPVVSVNSMYYMDSN
jgi:hypothetical protein